MTRAFWVAFGLLFLGCHGDAHEGDHTHGEEGGHGDHGHGHGDGVAIGITRWSDTLELFAEHPPAVAGQEVAFLAHVTILDGFPPLDDARVRLSLSGPTDVVAEAPMLRSGIYRPVFTAPAPGIYRGTLTVLEGGGGSVGDFEVEVYPTEAVAHAAHPGDEEDDGSISFLKEQQWRVPFDTAFAERQSIRPSVEVTGEMTTPPGGVAHVHAPIAGRLIGPGAGFPSPGTWVEAGQLLATIAPTPGAPEDAARASLAVVEAQARLEAGQIEVERTQRLAADQAIPRRRVEEAQRRLRVAEASVSAARRAQSLYSAAQRGRGRGSWRITAPIGGVVDGVDVSPGEAVGANELLFRIVDPSLLWVRADVPEAWASRFVADANASFQLVGDATWHTIELESDESASSLVHASRTVDAGSRTVRVVYALGQTEDAFRVGAAVHVLVPVGPPVDAVTVPRSAILEVEGRSVVYVQVEGESFAERSVRTGATEGSRIAIAGGIEEGERVVTRGAHLIRLAGSSGAVGHGHVH
ncbi:MAG: efflux RND transporter periplasmic adaptor subunit [Sandaracinaceae bacterium]